jgi:hypothetical protein
LVHDGYDLAPMRIGAEIVERAGHLRHAGNRSGGDQYAG